MTSVNTEMLLDGLRKYFVEPEMQQYIDQLKEGSIVQKIKAALRLIPEAVAVAEKLVDDIGAVGAGSEKKKAVVKFFDDVIEAPFWLEPFDDNIIGMVVDAVVGWYNLRIGKGWLSVIRDIIPGL